MTDREKLIELIYEGKMKRIDICANNEDCSLCARDADGEYCCDGVVADHLIANGVVVREKGEWEGTRCSRCGGSYMDYADADSYPAIGEPKPDFCPNCGADMRKGENDG